MQDDVIISMLWGTIAPTGNFRSKAAAERSLVTSAMKCMAALHLAFVKAVEKLPPRQLPQQSVFRSFCGTQAGVHFHAILAAPN